MRSVAPNASTTIVSLAAKPAEVDEILWTSSRTLVADQIPVAR
jgi:hypothetical protein